MSSVAKLTLVRNGFAVAVMVLWLLQYFGPRHAFLTAALWTCFACGTLAQLVLLVLNWAKK